MAANASAVWRSRPSGNNNNGGGFDCAISSAATGSNLTWATSGGVTTLTDSTAAAFTTGMVNSAINISGVVQVTILTRVDASNITVTPFPPWLPQNSGGGKYNWTVGSGTDYSQQNSAQVTQSSTANTSTSTTTLTDTGASFTAALIGNGIRVAGTGITTTFTFITAVPTSTTLTLQTSPGTTGTSVSYNIGGGWADFWTNPASAIVAGNTVYILGGASPSYASPDYTPPSNTSQAGSTTAGPVRFVGDPATPTTNGYGGYPLIKCPQIISQTSGLIQRSAMFLFASANGNNCIFNDNNSTGLNVAHDLIFDQNGYDVCIVNDSGGQRKYSFRNFEAFSSAAKRGTNAQPAVSIGDGNFTNQYIVGCNIHDCIGPGLFIQRGCTVSSTIIAKNGSDGASFKATDANIAVSFYNNTVDGNAGDGMVFSSTAGLFAINAFNNIISNHTTAGKYAVNASGAGTQAVNDRLKGFVDYNSLYNNAGSYNAISPGAHDTVLSSDPYVGQSTENYTLNIGVLGTANAFPGAAFPQHGSGQTATVQNYIYPGAVQPSQPTVVVNATIENYLTEAA